MKSLLIITPFLPYPIRSGGDQAQYNIIENLRNFYHISLVFPINQDNYPKDLRKLAQKWENVRFYPYPLKSQVSNMHFLFQKLGKALNRYLNPNHRSATIIQALDNKDFLLTKKYRIFLTDVINIEQPDIIQVEFLQNLNVVECLPKGIKKVFIHHELGFIITDRTLKNYVLTQRQQRRVIQKKKLEISRLNQYDNVITLTDNDKYLLLDSGVKVPIYVSPCAVNTSVKPYNGWNKKIVFIGGHQHRPNHEGMDWFLHDVTPLVKWEDYPETELLIIGSGWPQTYGHNYNGLKVNLLGYVDDLASCACRCIMIVPVLTGSGMRMKILDAAAMSVPFVSTSIGAEGLDFIDNESCVIGNKPAEFAKALLSLMENDMLRETIAIKAHEIYLEKYSLPALIKNRQAIYEEIMIGDEK